MPNLFDDIPDALPEELVEVLAAAPGARVERIVSRGHASPAGFWYDQDEREIVVLLSGAARVAFDGGAAQDLRPGDWLDIPSHARHRVEWTAPDTDTVWLAVFLA